MIEIYQSDVASRVRLARPFLLPSYLSFRLNCEYVLVETVFRWDLKWISETTHDLGSVSDSNAELNNRRDNH